MESLSPENVKRISGFLDFKDMVNFSQTRQPFQADLKPLIRKAERVMLKETGKLKKVITTLTRALLHQRVMLNDWFDGPLPEDTAIRWATTITVMLNDKFALHRLPAPERVLHAHYNIMTPGIFSTDNMPPLEYFDGSAANDDAIVRTRWTERRVG